MDKNLLKLHILLFLCPVIWGGAFIAGKVATQLLSPESVAFLRYLTAGMILVPIMLYTEKERRRPTGKDWLLFILLGLTGVFLYNLCFFIAAKYAPVIKSSLVIAANAPLIALASGIFLKEKITRNNIAGMISAVLGAFIIITDGDPGVLIRLGLSPIDMVLVTASLSYVVFTVMSKKIMRKFSPLATTTYSTCIGTMMLLPFIPISTVGTEILTSGWDIWSSVLYLGVVNSVLTTIWWSNGIQKVGPARASIYINVMPLSATILAAVFFNERLNLYHVIGAVLVIGGVYLSSSFKRINKTNIPVTESDS